MDEQSSIAQVLRKAREAKQQSLRSAAADLGVNPSYLSRVENGARPPSASLRERAEGVYGIDGDTLALSSGVVPEDVMEIIRRHPEVLAELRARYG